MLEDDFCDVLRKALAGRGMTPDSLAAAAGIEIDRIQRLMRGDVDPEAAAAAGSALGLDPDACRKHPSYQPPDAEVAGITRLELPFAGGSVNVWCIACDDGFVVFDAGFDVDECHAALHQVRPDPPQHVFVTHGHRDHTGALADWSRLGAVIHGPAGIAASVMQPGDARTCGSLVITACDLSGHASPALGYLVSGLDVPVLVTGDAMFAGSIGRCATPAAYRHALERLRAVLAPLPGETVLLPGHGPPTTLEAERRANPFL